MQLAQVAVAGEAAGGENDRLRGADEAGGALGGLDLDADHAARKLLFADDFGHAEARVDLNAEFLGSLREDGAVALALRKRRDVRARIERAEDLDDVVLELHAEGFEPGDGAVGVVAEDLDAFGIAAEVAGSERLLHVVFGRVLDALARLAHGVGGVDEALGDERVAAREGELLEDEDVLGASLGGLDGGGHAGAARAHDDDFVGFVPFEVVAALCGCGAREGGCGGADACGGEHAAAGEIRGHDVSPAGAKQRVVLFDGAPSGDPEARGLRSVCHDCIVGRRITRVTWKRSTGGDFVPCVKKRAAGGGEERRGRPHLPMRRMMSGSMASRTLPE